MPVTPPQRTEQEPVAWWNDTGTYIDLNVSGRGAPLYTAPPQRKPLTDEQIESLLMNWPEDGIAFFEFARAIEAAHGIKENT